MKTLTKFIAISAMIALVGCKSTEEKLAEKLVACDGDACTEFMKELVQLPLEKQLAVKQLMMLDSNYVKKMEKQASIEKVESVSMEGNMYMKMQSAAFEEVSKTMDFKWIGYLDPSCNGFFITEGENNSFEAVSYTELGSCPAQSKWIIKPIVSGKELSYSCSIVSENETACAEISEKFLSLCK